MNRALLIVVLLVIGYVLGRMFPGVGNAVGLP